MTEINVISGFLGAGKTTFIKELLKENEAEGLVLIENEFGEVGVDSDFLQEAGIQIKELNSGCICCSLVGDFTEALHKVVETYHPSRIIIEPSGVGKLSDIKKAIDEAKTLTPDLHLDGSVVIVDVKKCKMYAKNFKEFYEDQIHYADMIILSHVDMTTEEKVNETVEIIRDMNKIAKIVTTDYHLFSATELMNLLHQEDEMQALLEETHHHHHHDHDENCECGCHDYEHHHHEHDEECECEHEHHHHHHEHDENCECGCHDHEHHHHEHDEECECEHEHHHHHHDHDENCTCGCHDHEHHHHHADEVFVSWGKETALSYTQDEVRQWIDTLLAGTYGMVLRIKGMVKRNDGAWQYFDVIPEEVSLYEGLPCYTGKICVIGKDLNEEGLSSLFEKE